MNVYRVFVRVVLATAITLGVVAPGIATSAQEATPVASPETDATSQPAATPTDTQLRDAGVNELGVVPVIMYHTFTSDPANTTEWTRTFDGFRDQLQQLYDLGFVTISMRDFLDNRIDVPLGKHPVVLTFDDAAASQLLIDEAADGSITPRANSAVGVLEAFFAAHPDFGHSAVFAVVSNYCFADADIDEVNSYRTCDAKLQWLADHGYEIANHTEDHADLSKADADTFAEEVGGTATWIDERVKGPANLSRVLVLPYGGRPTPGNWVDSMMTTGFEYDGQTIQLEAVVEVAGGPMYSPSSTWWDPFEITRINSDPASMDYWLGQIADGDVLIYTSDGNPDTITVPNPIPHFLANEFSAKAVKASGKQLVRYNTEQIGQKHHTTPAASEPPVVAGEPPDATPAPLAVGDQAATTDSGVRLRQEPGTEGEILKELDAGEVVTIVAGPASVADTAWWQVKTADGTVGWVTASFLAPAP